MRRFLKILSGLLCLTSAFSVAAQNQIEYSAEVLANVSSGDFAPYFIGSLNGGRIVRKSAALADLAVSVSPDYNKRFSWGAGVEVLTGYSSANFYDRWDAATQLMTKQQNRPSAIWLQQLYGELKYRGVFLRAGIKDSKSALLDERLSSGDLTRSSNARGIPGAEIGFIDFQDIPFTKGWVQIDGVIEYGKFTDNEFSRKQYNYYSWLLATDLYFTYKRCYFRTKPSMPFSVTIGMQTAGQFGGNTEYYFQGRLTKTDKRGFRFVDVFKMFLPTQGNGNDYYEGSTLGTWDFKARYRLPKGDEISFVFEGPWEDGSGIGRMNGFDGLWGLYYTKPGRGLINGAAMEWLDFRNQSGPIHWAPQDSPGTTITTSATGGDNYYNNDTYTAFTNYGMAIATPFLVSPIYNLNGYPAFQYCRARGIHLALTGSLAQTVDYSIKYSWQQAWGMGRIPRSTSLIDNSMMLNVKWDASCLLKGLSVNAELAFDAGSLRGNNFGALLGVRYSGNLKFKK